MIITDPLIPALFFILGALVYALASNITVTRHSNKIVNNMLANPKFDKFVGPTYDEFDKAIDDLNKNLNSLIDELRNDLSEEMCTKINSSITKLYHTLLNELSKEDKNNGKN